MARSSILVIRRDVKMTQVQIIKVGEDCLLISEQKYMWNNVLLTIGLIQRKVNVWAADNHRAIYMNIKLPSKHRIPRSQSLYKHHG